MSGVTVNEKKQFVRWFLKNNDMKRRECVWVLNYLISHENTLKNVHFVEESHYCPRAMIMSTTKSSGIPFRFYKASIMTADVEKAFHDIRLNPGEDMYIQLNFNDNKSSEYFSVLEENPYMPRYLQVNDEDTKLVENLINTSISNFNKNKLLEKIDEALDNKNESDFNVLVKLL